MPSLGRWRLETRQQIVGPVHAAHYALLCRPWMMFCGASCCYAGVFCRACSRDRRGPVSGILGRRDRFFFFFIFFFCFVCFWFVFDTYCDRIALTAVALPVDFVTTAADIRFWYLSTLTSIGNQKEAGPCAYIFPGRLPKQPQNVSHRDDGGSGFGGNGVEDRCVHRGVCRGGWNLCYGDGHDVSSGCWIGGAGSGALGWGDGFLDHALRDRSPAAGRRG